MADNPDWWARGLAGFSTALGLVALWLNWQKNARDVEAQRPQFALNVERKGPRGWFVKMSVTNPRSVPIAWRQVLIIAPKGALLVRPNARRIENDRVFQFYNYSDVSPHLNVTNYPRMIAPGQTDDWEGLVVVDEFSSVRKTDAPFIVPVIDSYDMRPSLLRRMAMRIWPSAIRM